MKKNFPVTEVEHHFKDQDFLVSSTDLNGVITYSNEVFAEVAGFTVDELVGKSHNIVRHPNMPQPAFADLWQTVQAGKPWMGIVQNRSKDGGYYWVDAFVTPVYEKGRCIGYESVRVKPDPVDKARAERLYKAIGPAATSAHDKGVNTLAVEKQVARITRRGFLHLIQNKIMLVAASAFALALVAGNLGLSRLLFSVVMLIIGGVSVVTIKALFNPINQITRHIRTDIIDNPVMQAVYSGNKSEAGQIELGIRLLKASQRTILGRLQEHAHQLKTTAHLSADQLKEAVSSIDDNQSQTNLVATAINQMVTTVNEVAKNTAAAADAAQQADMKTRQGQAVLNRFVTLMESLADDVGRAATTMQRLLKDSEQINRVTELINQIAEQTNLLALNAAIEAARAGEQGRGFAVVADEVRALSKRTQDATVDIQNLVESFREAVNQSADTMQDNNTKSSAGVKSLGSVSQTLDEIAGAVDTIHGMNTQIATASEQQSAVAEQINQNVVSIRDVTDQTAAVANQSQSRSENLILLAAELDALIQRFKKSA